MLDGGALFLSGAQLLLSLPLFFPQALYLCLTLSLAPGALLLPLQRASQASEAQLAHFHHLCNFVNNLSPIIWKQKQCWMGLSRGRVAR